MNDDFTSENLTEYLDDDDMRLLFSPGAIQAAQDAWHGTIGPVVTLSTVHAGALMGFGPALARAVLADIDWLSYVNGVWEDYQNTMDDGSVTGLDSLPYGFQQALEREQFEGGEQLNLRIAHAAGRGWTDLDLDADLLSLELAACEYSQDMLETAGARGRSEDATESAESEETEPWKVRFHADALTIVARPHDTDPTRIIVQVESRTAVRMYRITLHWADGTQSELEPCQTGLGMMPARFGDVATPDGKLPTSVSVGLL